MTSSARRTSDAARFMLPVLLVAILGAGILVMREATQSRHEEMPADSRVRVVIAPRSNRPESDQSIERVSHAHLSFCQLEVGSRMETGLEEVSRDPLQYSVVMAPALDSTDRKQFRGCIEDWIVDNHWIDVVEIEEFTLR